MKLLATLVAWFAFVQVGSPALAGTCSGADRSTSSNQFGFGSTTTMAIQYDTSQWGGTDISSIVATAISAWHTECSGSGTDYPRLLNGGDGSYDITLTRAHRSPDSRCGSEISGTITVYNLTRDGTPCSDTALVIAHEIGHSLGLGHTADSTCCDHYMMHPSTVGSLSSRSVQSQECNEVKAEWVMPNEPEHPDNQEAPGSEPDPTQNPDCQEEPCSPIVLDMSGNGYRFSSLDGGVKFDIDADGVRETISWTDRFSDEAFLALDRNGNGNIDSGFELFGDATEQPASDEPNGFRALAVFDAPEHGGNGDGWITPSDDVFSRLLLWRDRSHDGMASPFELIPLSGSGVEAIELRYVSSRRRDPHGNLLRWASRVRFERGLRLGAVDVIFLQE